MNLLKNTFVQDLLFILTDFSVSYGLMRVILDNPADVFLVTETLVFALYPLSVYWIHQWPPFVESHRALRDRIPNFLFWIKLSHVAAFIYIPIGLFVVFIVREDRTVNYDEILLIVFLILIFVPIFIGKAMGQEDRYRANDIVPELPYPRYILMNFGFIITFAFVSVAFKDVGNYMMTELTKEITNIYNNPGQQPLWYLKAAYQIIFLWTVYIPIRMWLFIPQSKNLFAKISFAAAIIIVFINGL
jgi:hypothetical protein